MSQVHVYNLASIADDIETLRKDAPGEVSTGRATGSASFNKFGNNPAISTTREDVWSGGGVWVPPTEARLHDLVSTSSNDSASGTGAQSITVFGLVAGVATSETVTTHATDGTISVPTVNAYTIIYRMLVATAGSVGWNVGAITATAQTDGTVTAHMTATFGQTTMAIYTVPTGLTLLIYDWYLEVNKSGGQAGGVDGYLFAKPSGGAWNLKHVIGARSDGSSHAHHPFPFPLSFAAGTTVKCSAICTASMDIDAGFQGKLVTA